jgi:putative sigma-54 modulation protein
MESTKALKEYAEQKTEKIMKYLVEPVEIHWVLSVEKFRHKAEATVVAKNISVEAHVETEEMYATIDSLITKLETQCKKHKEKIKQHKFHEQDAASVRYSDPAKGVVLSDRPRIVETENLFAKPMSIDEATMQLEMSKRYFMVFTDADTNKINVLYKREDGNLGLIDVSTK